MITNKLITGGVLTPDNVLTTVEPTAIVTIILCNVGSDSTMPDVNIYLVKSGNAPDTVSFSNLIVNNIAIPTNETVFYSTERLVLDEGDSIHVGASISGAVAVTVSSLSV